MPDKQPLPLRETLPALKRFDLAELFASNTRADWLRTQRKAAEDYARRYFDDPNFEYVEIVFEGQSRGLFRQRKPSARHEFVEAFMRLPLWERPGPVHFNLSFLPKVTVPHITFASVIDRNGATFAELIAELGGKDGPNLHP